ncbi:MAG: acetyl-CoA carboxylase biotin carboxylase subunit [Alphaproteobacteria bacterium]|nr:acetyl-CoA carboxylase biotin carboxylase subunit [Alphaproteobacteria bacterium]
MFEKVLIANRGEVALRIHRACKEMGIKTVAVHSTVDADAMHVRLADEAICIGPALARDSYLNKAAIISAALISGADAIHPGYGFLSENADFAEMVEMHGLTFIGPSSSMIRKMGNKVLAREAAKNAGLPILPGSDGAIANYDAAEIIAQKIGYPVLIKAANGGGGKGMKVAFCKEELESAFVLAQKEAKAAFGDDTVFIEKYLQNPRHIEVQVLADNYGHVVCLGERDCSLQRNNQKIVEETPSPALNRQQREELMNVVRNAIEKIGYSNAGTLEFLFEDGHFYFLEMNTRLQVEHPITEMVTGIDIVREQIRLASGAPLGYSQKDVRIEGCAIECRINAENPQTFIPSPGKIGTWHVPGGLWVRVDSAMFSGYKVPAQYDSLVAKLIVFGRTRNATLMRLRRALGEFVIDGIETTIPLHQRLVYESEFIDGQYNIHWLQHFLKNNIQK